MLGDGDHSNAGHLEKCILEKRERISRRDAKERRETMLYREHIYLKSRPRWRETSEEVLIDTIHGPEIRLEDGS